MAAKTLAECSQKTLGHKICPVKKTAAKVFCKIRLTPPVVCWEEDSESSETCHTLAHASIEAVRGENTDVSSRETFKPKCFTQR